MSVLDTQTLGSLALPTTNIFIPLIIALLISACAHHKDRRQPQEAASFATMIKRDGSKQFNYSMSTGSQRGGRGEGRGGHGERPPRGEGGGRGGPRDSGQSEEASLQQEEKIRQQLLDKVDLELAENGYCRNGYIELDYYAINGQAQLRGECQESATEKDRLLWPNY